MKTSRPQNRRMCVRTDVVERSKVSSGGDDGAEGGRTTCQRASPGWQMRDMQANTISSLYQYCAKVSRERRGRSRCKWLFPNFCHRPSHARQAHVDSADWKVAVLRPGTSLVWQHDILGPLLMNCITMLVKFPPVRNLVGSWCLL